MKKIKKALISVSDKKDLGSLLKVLAKYKIELISSGGTFKEIKNLNLNAKKFQSILVHQKFLVEELKHYTQKFMLVY